MRIRVRRTVGDRAAADSRWEGCVSFFFLNKRQQLRFTLFPYTTLFRSKMTDVGSSRRSSAPIAWKASSHEQRSEEHTSELQSRLHLVCRLLLEKKKSSRRYRANREPSRRSYSAFDCRYACVFSTCVYSS